MKPIAVWCLTCAMAVQVAATPPGSAVPPAPPTPREFVFVISVDGLRSDAILAGGSRRLPNFYHLLNGSTTLNARPDHDFTITLPNHTSMITGRPVGGPDGHGWTGNTDPPPEATIQSNVGHDVVSMFDVAHEHGVRTGSFYGKSKFSLWETSFNAGRAPQDMAITRSALCQPMSKVTDEAIASFHEWDRGLIFMHYAETDLVAHANGWDITPGSPYMNAVAQVDAQLGRLMDAISADATRKQRCAIILTTDHGGGSPFTSHVAPDMWVNYIIPFLVWVGDEAPTGDLYDINAEVRRDPSIARPPMAPHGDEAAERGQPIHNGDAANVALGLLGLPPVPGSVFDVHQDLRVLWPAVPIEP